MQTQAAALCVPGFIPPDEPLCQFLRADLQRLGRDVFQRDLEKRFSCRRSTMSNVLSLMEKNGLIERVSVVQDARLKKIVLTDRAVELHRMITDEISDREKRMTEGISEKELECFFKVIDKIKTNLEDNND